MTPEQIAEQLSEIRNRLTQIEQRLAREPGPIDQDMRARQLEARIRELEGTELWVRSTGKL